MTQLQNAAEHADDTPLAVSGGASKDQHFLQPAY